MTIFFPCITKCVDFIGYIKLVYDNSADTSKSAFFQDFFASDNYRLLQKWVVDAFAFLYRLLQVSE